MQKLLQLIAALTLFLAPAWANEDQGTLVVTSNVAGSVVFIDNIEVGKTPLEHALKPGSYSMRVVARYHDPWVSRIQISAKKKTREEIELDEGGGTVEFVVNPAGATVNIDGKDAGKAPIRLTDLQAGKSYRYVISADVHDGATGTFSFNTGENILIVEQLEASAGKWEVRSTPPGADVYINDELIGQTPLSATGIDSDLHQVRVSKEGFGSVLREVDTRNGNKGELTVKLPKGSATVHVATKHEQGKIYVNGNLLGEGRKASFDLQRGVYELRIEAPGKQAGSARLPVPRKGKVAYTAKLADETSKNASTITLKKPITSHWAFWTTLGGLGAGAGVATAVIVINNQPEPPPEGDVWATLP